MRTCTIISIIALLAALTGCSSEVTAPPPLPVEASPAVTVPRIAEPIQRAAVEIRQASLSLDELKTRLTVLPMTIDWQTPHTAAAMHLEAADAANSDALDKTGQAVESVKADQRSDAKAAKTIEKQTKQIAKLEADDPVRTWLRYIGLAGLAGGAAFMAICLIWIKPLIPLAIAVIAFGAISASLARFLPQIEWAILGLLVVGVGFVAWYVVKHQAQIRVWINEEVPVDDGIPK